VLHAVQCSLNVVDTFVLPFLLSVCVLLIDTVDDVLAVMVVAHSAHFTFIVFHRFHLPWAVSARSQGIIGKLISL